jgi:putative Ca2+/H+ antiporter (TMEM165/GDT1 family)
MAAWALIPDKADDGGTGGRGAGGVFLTTLVAFFLVEIGDKTQIATTLLAARFEMVWAVTAGTTLGMMLANAPVVFLGDALLRRVSLKWVRIAAAAIFALIGAWIILNML